MLNRDPKWLAAAKAQNRSPSSPQFDWLARGLARAGIMPPAEAALAIRGGRIRVNGSVQRQPLAELRPTDLVEVDGRRVSLAAETVALMLHKPAGAVCARVDPEKIATVFEVLEKTLSPDLKRYGWHAIGRLDRDTTGLLLFTNDERMVAHVTAPKTNLPKRYLAQVAGRATDEKLQPLREGIQLDDGPARPAVAIVRGEDRVELTITEGRHHQVKRMLGLARLPVKALHRAAIGALELDVPVGRSRRLTESEIVSALGFSRRPRL